MRHRLLSTALFGTALALLATFGLAAPAQASGPLHPVDLGTLRGFCCSQALDVNDNGVVVGASAIADGENPPNHAFRWARGHLTDLGTLGGRDSSANAVNDHGDIAGSSQLPDGSTHAVLWHNGHIQDLGILPGGGDSIASDINNHGVVVGRAVDGSGQLVGFRWFAGVMTPLVTVDGIGVPANAVNEQGQVAGVLQNAALQPVRLAGTTATVLTEHFGQGNGINECGDVAGAFVAGLGQGFLYHNGQFRALASPAGAEESQAMALNDRRDTVGFTFVAKFQPVLWPRGGAPQILPALHGGLGFAWGINNKGQVVGWSATTAAGPEYHAVLWTR